MILYNDNALLNKIIFFYKTFSTTGRYNNYNYNNNFAFI